MTLIWRWYIRDNQSLGVAAKRIPQKKGELRIAVVHVSRLALGYVNERIDHVSKCGQAFIDHAGLFETLTHGVSLFRPLTSRQVDYVKARGFNVPDTPLFHGLAFDDSGQHRVWARALFVQRVGPDVSVLSTQLNDLNHIFSWLNHFLLETFNIHSLFNVFTDV